MSVHTSPVLGLDKLVDVDAHEGPVYVEPEHALYFTSLPVIGLQAAIKRLDLTTQELTIVREDANGANGMTLGPDGRLLVCEQGSSNERARITAVDTRTGEAETLVDALAGTATTSTASTAA